jgi:hypothetical protein
MTSEGLPVLDEAECSLLFRSRTLGRVGVHLADQLAVLPVYYAVMDRDVVFRTAQGNQAQCRRPRHADCLRGR